MPSLTHEKEVALAKQQSSIKIKRISGQDELLRLEKQWNELLDDSEADSIFLRVEWVRAWLEAYGERDLMALTGFDESDRLIGIAPFFISRWPKPGRRALRVLRFIGDGTDDVGALGVIIKRGFEKDFSETFIEWLNANRSDWDALELNFLTGNDASDDAMLEAIAARGWVTRQRRSPHMVLALPESWEAFLATLSQRRRAALRSASRKVAAKEVKLLRCETPSQIKSALEDLFRLHTVRWNAKGDKGAFADAARRELYKRVALTMMKSGRLDLWTMSIDGVTVAVEFGFIQHLASGGVRTALQSGFDPKFRELSVGALLEAKVIERAICAGVREYDFLEGEHEFKRRWGARREEYRSVRCAPRGGTGAAWVRVSRVKAAQKLWAALRAVSSRIRSTEAAELKHRWSWR